VSKNFNLNRYFTNYKPGASYKMWQKFLKPTLVCLINAGAAVKYGISKLNQMAALTILFNWQLSMNTGIQCHKSNVKN